MHRAGWAALALAAAVFSACRGSEPSATASAGAALPSVVERTGIPSGKIDHVVIVVQENRSFDNLFHGYPNADSANYGYAHGTKVKLVRVALDYPVDINHDHDQFLEDYDGGKNDGFDDQIKAYASPCPTSARNTPSCWIFAGGIHKRIAYSFVPAAKIAPYWTMASRFALSDRTFASNNGPSYPSHQYLIAGQSANMVENPQPSPTPGPGVYAPWGCDSPQNVQTWDLAKTGEIPGPFPCFQYLTIASRLDDARVSWAYYAPQIGMRGDAWSAFDAIWNVRYGADWVRNVRSPETRILDDVAAGRLPSVSWVVPSAINSDHAGGTGDTGPQWVASIVNAIGSSKYWKSTIVVVTWDEWGGWYDHVPPPQIADPHTGLKEGLGFRIPLIVISPYAKQHYVSHVPYEIASTLKLVEELFALPSLGGADRRAGDLSDMLDFNQPPRAYRKIPASMRAQDFLRQPPSDKPPDD